tara:strand:+ start:2510 stop:3034 length:525 start_codon:yes stop_codon:yes gene_type:complete
LVKQALVIIRDKITIVETALISIMKMLYEKTRRLILTLAILSSVLLASCFSTVTEVEDTTIEQKEEVILYSASWCHWCHKMKEFLAQNDIDFIDRDYEDEGDRSKLIKFASSIGYRGELGAIPLLIIRGQILVGYRPIEVLKILDKQQGAIQTLTKEEYSHELRGSRVFKYSGE